MSTNTVHTVGVIMNGVTGRMGTNQHLIRSILAIRRQGGARSASGETVLPEPVLVGRSEEKVRTLAMAHGIKRYSTDLDTCLSDASNRIYFDSQSTNLRVTSVLKAIRAGKAVYCEKPLAPTSGDALTLWREAKRSGVKNGVVQDKLWLPGIMKLRGLLESGFFGTVLSVRGEFGYWVFDGRKKVCQRPSWNYRKEEGGGIIVDMFTHWRYVVDTLFGGVKAVSCTGATHIPVRADENGAEYECTAEDAAYATLLCGKGTLCQMNASWSVRVRRDDLLTLQVDGTLGSAVAGLRKCYAQSHAETPMFTWNPDIDNPVNFFTQWKEVQPEAHFDNAFKAEWEMFLRHVALDEPFRWTFLEGVKGNQLAECAQRSWEDRRWVEVPELKE
jgi:predicted dehydrogenase